MRRGLPRLEDLPLGLNLWLLEDLRWLRSARLFCEEVRLPSARPSRLCCLSLRDFPERLLSLLRDDDVEEVVLPTLAAGPWGARRSPRLESPSDLTWCFNERLDKEVLSAFFAEPPFSRSLLLFFLYPCSPFPESRTLSASLAFLREYLCPLPSPASDPLSR